MTVRRIRADSNSYHYCHKLHLKFHTMIKRIVLTGGPCGGKTTALTRIQQHFAGLGYKVFTVPEVPTLVTAAGWNYMTSNHAFYYEGEKVILELQLMLEDEINRLAETCTEPCLLVCDRGALDISTYISAEMWQELCEGCHTTPEALMARYDAVIHMVTAADGAVHAYTTANNASRYEQADEAGLQLARELDRKQLNAWTGHPRLCVVDNSTDFPTKLQRVIDAIEAILPQA